MPILPDSVIADAYRSETPWTVLKQLTASGDRMAGHPGERNAATLLEQRFKTIGLDDITVDEFDIRGWKRGTTTLTVDKAPVDRTFSGVNEIIALPQSPPADLNGELVDVGYGRPADFEQAELQGKIVLATSGAPDGYGRWIHRNEKYARAVDHGATAFLYASDSEGVLPETGSISFTHESGEIPGFGVSYEVAHRLRLLNETNTLTVTLNSDCSGFPATSQNVSGSLGPDTDRQVLVTAHYDSHDIAEGAGDNGCGTALMVELARLLEQVADDLETRVRFVAFGAEELGMLGAEHWLQTHDGDRVKCQINIDGVGNSETLKVNNNGFEPVARTFNAVADELHSPIESEAVIRPHGDQWPFVKRGIPGIMTGSAGDGRFPYAHTAADTIDKINPRDLVSLAIPLVCGVYRLTDANLSVPHKSTNAIQAALHPDYESGLRAEGRWPWGTPPVEQQYR